MPRLMNAVADTSATTGTGALAVAGAMPAGFLGRTLSAAGVVAGDVLWLRVENPGKANEWEVGEYTFDGTNLARTLLYNTGNAGAAVAFTSGTKSIYLTEPAEQILFGVSPDTAIDPTTVTGANVFDGDSIAGSDGDAVASWANSGPGTADAAVQATSGARPLLKKGVNGVNGHNVVLGDGVNDFLRTTLGGTAFTGHFTFLLVAKITNIAGYQHLLCAGDDSVNGHRRGVLKWGTGGKYVSNSHSFNGQNADAGIASGGTALATLTAGTPVVLGVVFDGTNLTGYVNGVQVWHEAPSPNPLVSFTATPISLFTNNSTSEFFNGALAYVAMIPSAVDTSTLTGLTNFLTQRYAITSAVAGHFPLFNQNAITTSTLYSDYAGRIIYGGTQPILIGGSVNAVFDTLADFSINGYIGAAGTGDSNHVFRGDGFLINVVALQGTTTETFSSGRFLRFTGEEMGAIGFANPGTGYVITDGSYWEISDFAHNNTYGKGAIIQTKDNSGIVTQNIRFLIDTDETMKFKGSTGNTLLNITGDDKLGFFGVTAVVRQLLATGAGHTVDDVIAVLQNLGLCKQS